MGVFANEIKDNGLLSHSRNKVAYYFKRIGISVLFSGAAIGVSHVVQSTRAGADFGLSLLPVLILCLILKYPAFLFGPLYTEVTGESVVKGYSRFGIWTIGAVAFVFLGVMFTVVSALALLASGIFLALTSANDSISTLLLSSALIVLSTAYNLKRSFSKFHNSIKWVFFLLVIFSVACLVLAISKADFASIPLSLEWGTLGKQEIFFIAALIGWMPAGLDLPMMHSQWVLAREKKEARVKSAIEDFQFGYVSTAFLAVLFLLIGAVFLFGKPLSFAQSAPSFSVALLNIYKDSLGEWAGIVMGGCLFLAIFSSLIVVIDGFPRVLAELNQNIFQSGRNRYLTKRSTCSWVQAVGALFVLTFLSSSIKVMVDFATTISFLVAPLFVFLNHRLILTTHFRKKFEVPNYQKVWSILGLIFFVFSTTYYLWIRFI